MLLPSQHLARQLYLKIAIALQFKEFFREKKIKDFFISSLNYPPLSKLDDLNERLQRAIQDMSSDNILKLMHYLYVDSAIQHLPEKLLSV